MENKSNAILSFHVELYPVNYKFELRNNYLYLMWDLENENKTLKIKDGYNIILWNMTNNITKDKFHFYGSITRLDIPVKEFTIRLKEFFQKCATNIKSIKDKYINPHNSIANKHCKLINSSVKYVKLIKKYTDGELMYIVDKEKLHEDVTDPFLVQFDPWEKGLRIKGLYNGIMQMIKDFPRYNKEFSVWRTIRFDKTSKKGDVISQNLPFSTSLLPYIALDFITDSCCIYHIKIPPKYPVIFINKYINWQEEVIVTPSKIKVNKCHKVKKDKINQFLNDPVFPHLRTYTYMYEPDMPYAVKPKKKTNGFVYFFDCSIELIEEI